WGKNRHANRRTSDLVCRFHLHHRHRNWLCRQIGDERDSIWTAPTTRKCCTRLVEGQWSPRHLFLGSGNSRHAPCTSLSLVVDLSPLTHPARRRPRRPDKRRQQERSFRNSRSNRGRHDNRCVAPRAQLSLRWIIALPAAFESPLIPLSSAQDKAS